MGRCCTVAHRHVDAPRVGRCVDAPHLQLPQGRHRDVVLPPRRRVHRRVELLEVRLKSYSVCLRPSSHMNSTL